MKNCKIKDIYVQDYVQIVEVGNAHPSENMFVGKDGKLYPCPIIEGNIRCKCKCKS